MATIYRTIGPGEHSLAGTLLLFDADGLATSDDPDVLALVSQFPDVFTLMEEVQAPDDPPPGTEDPMTEEALEKLTVAELRALATKAEIPRVSSLNKAELIDALLEEPEA